MADAAHAAPFAYISNWGNRTVSVIDTSTNAVVKTVPVSFFPEGVAVHPSGTRVYVGDTFGTFVSVIDTATNTVTDTFRCNFLNNTHGLAVNPAGTRLYMATGDRVCVIDTDPSSPTYHTVVATLIGKPDLELANLWGVAINPSGSRVYVANALFGNVLVIDTATNTVVDTVSLGMGVHFPQGVVVSPSGTRVYVANDSGGGAADQTLLVIDTGSDTVIDTLRLGLRSQGVAVNSSGTRLYVTNIVDTSGKGSVSVIDTNTNTVIDTVPVGNSPYGIAVHPSDALVYVANTASNNVSVIDADPSSPTYHTVIATVAVGLGRSPRAFGQFIGPAVAPPQPELVISPSSLEFGSIPVATSKNLTFTIKNSGGGTLTGSASTSAPFSIVGGNSFSLTANQTKVITIRFSPTSAATFNGNVSFTSNGGNASPTVTGAGATDPTQFILTVNKSGKGSGTISSSPAGITCGTDCKEIYDVNTVITLTALPGQGSFFLNWGGVCAGNGACVVTMDSAKLVQATFDLVPLKPIPSITKIAPLKATPGYPVTISGRNFGATQGSGYAMFGSDRVEIISWNATRITIKAPAGPLFGDMDVSVVTDTNGPTSPKSFELARVPVLIVPGILGSWSTQAFCNNQPVVNSALDLLRKLPGYAAATIPSAWSIDPLSYSYLDLSLALRNVGFDPRDVPYDWRKFNQLSANVLIKAIQNAKLGLPKDQKVHVVAHSMGGLITRYYIQNKYKGDIDKFILLGTPNNGAVDAYYTWEGGDFRVLKNFWSERGLEFLLEKMKEGCLVGGVAGLTDVYFVRTYIPSVKELLPTFPFLVRGANQAANVMCEQNTFLQRLNSNLATLTSKKIKMKMFLGRNLETLKSIDVTNSNCSTQIVTWEDGQPSGDATYGDGDGRGLEIQNLLNGVPFETKDDVKHGDLPRQFINEVIDFLRSE